MQILYVIMYLIQYMYTMPKIKRLFKIPKY